jgi:hypothetical protein
MIPDLNSRILKILALLLMTIIPLQAGQSRQGLGIIIGAPTGLSYQRILDNRHTMDAALAWNFGGDGFISLHGDYLWYSRNYYHLEDLPMNIHLGLGLAVASIESKKRSDMLMGVRFPVGTSWVSRELPLEIFAEIVPIFEIVPASAFGLDAGLGFRIYF